MFLFFFLLHYFCFFRFLISISSCFWVCSLVPISLTFVLCLLFSFILTHDEERMRGSSTDPYTYTFFPICRSRIATVQLDIVDTPLRESVGVRLKMTEDARITSTSLVAKVLVNAKVQPFTVDLPWCRGEALYFEQFRKFQRYDECYALYCSKCSLRENEWKS